MRRFLYGLIALALLTGCGGGSDDESRPSDVKLLYHSIVRLAHVYADSIRMAPDSATAVGAFERFNARLDTINFSVAPDTDLQLTEGENDTIYLNLMAVRRIYDRKLSQLGLKQRVESGEQQAASQSEKSEKPAKEKAPKEKSVKDKPKSENSSKEKSVGDKDKAIKEKTQTED